MPLWIPGSPEFQFRASDHLTTRPGNTYGALITASASVDTYGSYTEVLADTAITEDCYGLAIIVSEMAVSGSIRNGTITVGKDEAGGTSYTDWLTDLIVGNAAQYADGGDGPTFYYFPMYIKAGTSLAAKLANQTASATCRCAMVAYGRPKYPQAVRCASKFENFGATTGNGTSLTSGTTSEGSWTQVGTNPTIQGLWWWQFGWQAADDTMANVMYHVDLARGDASNKHIIFENAPVWHSSAERVIKPFLHVPSFYVGEATTADLIYMRAQCSGTSDQALQVAAYGVA